MLQTMARIGAIVFALTVLSVLVLHASCGKQPLPTSVDQPEFLPAVKAGPVIAPPTSQATPQTRPQSLPQSVPQSKPNTPASKPNAPNKPPKFLPPSKSGRFFPE